jgi:hypothetical protein
VINELNTNYSAETECLSAETDRFNKGKGPKRTFYINSRPNIEIGILYVVPKR